MAIRIGSIIAVSATLRLVPVAPLPDSLLVVLVVAVAVGGVFWSLAPEAGAGVVDTAVWLVCC